MFDLRGTESPSRGIGDQRAPAVLEHRPGRTSRLLGETMQVEGTRVYRVKAVAEMFDVSVSAVYRAKEAGKLDVLKIGSGKGSIRITSDAVRAFKTECAEAGYRSYVLGDESAEAADDTDTTDTDTDTDTTL